MLEIQNLKKSFIIHHNPLARIHHPDHIIKAVDGINLSINKGEIFGIIGESGSGKTTLAKTILRLYMADSGNVLYYGKNIFSMKKNELKQFRSKVQPIFQDADSTIDPRQKIESILEEPLLIHHHGTSSSRKQQIADILDQVNLSPSFMTELIIADEPASGLDPIVSTQILDLLLSLKKSHRVTYIFISHDLNTINYASDHIAVMYRGKIVEVLTGEKFEKSAGHPYTRFLQGLEEKLPEETMQQEIHHIHISRSFGCGYFHACPYSVHECHHKSPDLLEISPGHQIACHNIK
ncbi:MAG: ATP-binding cassette domain-containing protein [Chloroflexi bacterium]|nr:ATP-binding cassette domain-containing protein [Chloroflexota bacterium]